MALRSVRFGLRSRKLVTLVGHWMGDQKCFEGTLSRWSRLHLLVSTHQPALGPHGGLWPVLLMCTT
jgi:hypothetical protein